MYLIYHQAVPELFWFHPVTHQLLEKVPDPLVVTPLLHTRQQAVVEVFVDLVELRHFEKDGFNLRHTEDGLGRGGCSFQRLHGLRGAKSGTSFQEIYSIWYISILSVGVCVPTSSRASR